MLGGDPKLEQPKAQSAWIEIGRIDGSQVAVRLKLLEFDHIEFESDQEFAPGEQINIRLFRMGSIRARISSQYSRIVAAKFDEHCPV